MRASVAWCPRSPAASTPRRSWVWSTRRSTRRQGVGLRWPLPLGELDAIAVTYGPGLVGALVVGLAYAKGLSYAPPACRSSA